MEDCWGKYYNLTGNESIETCFWCGTKTWKRYCSEKCKEEYLYSFSWTYASGYCLRRYSNTCADCGTKQIYEVQNGKCHYYTSGFCNNECGDLGRREMAFVVNGICTQYASAEIQRNTKMEVHHIDPMLGEDRNWSKKNIPTNLICLCHKCHWKRHNANYQRELKQLSLF